ncbi:MAG TPA: hypothetical protein DCX54_04235 [Flavobacteriales bacterium]|nr:hypothetical protein [Flavobacteriales bacterium]
MNKIPSVVFLITFWFLLGKNLHAQYKNSISLGVCNERYHAASGSHARLYLNFTDNFRFNVEFTRFFDVSQKNATVTNTYLTREINTNIQYEILFGEHFGFYPILGFNYTFGREEVNDKGVITEKFKEELGLNFGGGFSYRIGRFTPYLESRGVVSNNAFVIHSFGLQYSFGKR